MGIRAGTIVFDFDGVIVDSGADIANAVAYTLKAFGRPVLSREEITGYVGGGAEQLIRKSFKDCGEDIIKEALPFYKKYYLDNCVVETRLYDNVRETLSFFSGKNLAILTNKPEDLTYRILERLEVMKFFKLVIGPESVQRLKPDPEGLVKVLQSLGESPQNALMVGDTYTDIEVGKRAGARTCGVTYGLGDTGALAAAGPDIIIDDMGELMLHVK
ncbi:phosphoglycolate phosphatase [Anaerobacterium chartisolvens]|uniref:Phosphoglycolate phosphatase n=1 Tax=Anaerobacterium chartisolvens TaxID=1297424 RepID=A0A369B658_9FIRM|nr:HAD-IA family hydrolase [Anaerobacterium chartisolvens]RCX16921.1 phosphoglycolate phosphatase [Anaerobacterium chartisolvens]